MDRIEPATVREEEAAIRSPMLELSNAMVRLYKEAFGRGPTKARAHFAGPDTLVVVLEQSMTTAERNLAAMGEHERLRDARLFFQYSMESEFRAIVERISALSRRARARGWGEPRLRVPLAGKVCCSGRPIGQRFRIGRGSRPRMFSISPSVT